MFLAADGVSAIARLTFNCFLFGSLVLAVHNGDSQGRLVPATAEQIPAGNRAIGGPCQSGACECPAWERFRIRLPVADPSVFSFQHFYFHSLTCMLLLPTL